jgi:hypothetical protein
MAVKFSTFALPTIVLLTYQAAGIILVNLVFKLSFYFISTLVYLYENSGNRWSRFYWIAYRC